MEKAIRTVLMIGMMIFLITGVFAVFDFNNGISDDASTSFDTTSGAPRCVLSENPIGWRFSDGTSTDVMAKGGCFQANGVSENGLESNPNCCPAGYTCNVNSGVCEQNSLPIIKCEDYQTQSDCEGFSKQDISNSIYQIFIENLESSGVDSENVPNINDLGFCTADPYRFETDSECNVYSNCACVWDDSKPEGQKCTSYFDSISCDDINNNPTQDSVLSCKTSSIVLDNNCDTGGTQVLKWQAKVLNSDGSISGQSLAGCSDGQKEFACPSTSTLPFFTFINFVLSFISVAFVYFLLKRK